jgi:hypothetical protein
MNDCHGEKKIIDPQICWVCPHPNHTRGWTEQDRAKGVDQVRKNIYYGGVVTDFKPRSEINNSLWDRFTFVNARPPYEYASSTELESYLFHGESSGCSPYWNFRYQKPQQADLKCTRSGPAPFYQTNK